MIIKDPDPEVWIRLFMSSNLSIKVMLYQINDPELDDGWLTDDEGLTHYNKFRKNILEKFKGEDSPYVQGLQSFEEFQMTMERFPRGAKRPSVS